MELIHKEEKTQFHMHLFISSDCRRDALIDRLVINDQMNPHQFKQSINWFEWFSQRKKVNVLWPHILKPWYLPVSLPLFDSKWNIFGVWTEQDIRGGHLETFFPLLATKQLTQCNFAAHLKYWYCRSVRRLYTVRNSLESDELYENVHDS